MVDSILGSTAAKWVAVILLVVGAYWFGGYNERDKSTAVDGAVHTLTNNLNAKLGSVVDSQVGGINTRLKDSFDEMSLQFSVNQKSLNDRYLSILNAPPGRVLVTPSVRSAADAETAKLAAASGRGDGSYYAELSNSSRDFLAGEARRADQCAVQLTDAQQTLKEWKRAVEDYNRTIAAAYATPEVILK